MHYRDNPFCVLALPVNASERQIVARMDELRTAARVGVALGRLEDPVWVSEVVRDSDSIERARSLLENAGLLPEAALQWYWLPRGANRLDEALALLMKGRYCDSIRIGLAELDKRLSAEDTFAARLNLALAGRLALDQERARNARLFLELRHVIMHYEAVCGLADTHGGLVCCERIDTTDITRACRTVLLDIFRGVEQLSCDLDSAQVDEALAQRAWCEQALSASRYLSSMVDALPAAPTAGTRAVRAQPRTAAAPSAVPLRRRASDRICAAIRSLLWDLCGYACALGILLLMYALGALVDWVLLGWNAPPLPVAAASAAVSPAPPIRAYTPGRMPQPRANARQWREHAEELEDELDDTRANLDDILADLDADEVEDLLDDLDEDDLEVLLDEYDADHDSNEEEW